MKSVKIKEDIFWVGVLDPELKVFDISMKTESGTTYNSYLLKSNEKIALFETVKEERFSEFLEKIEENVESITDIDYIVLNHTEPDHSGSIRKLLEMSPNTKVVASEEAIIYLKEMLNIDFKYIVVRDGDTLSLGKKTLKFLSVPYLHWPDSIVTYIEEDKILVTCDFFGSHFSFDNIFLSKLDESRKKEYMVSVRYYYMCIFSPFREYVLKGVEKIKNLEIDLILPGHGPVIDVDIKKTIETYEKWSLRINPNKNKTVIIVYTSAYGYTTELAYEIKKGIESTNLSVDVKLYELDIENFSYYEGEILREFQWADGIIFGSSTINADASTLIWNLLISLNPLVHGEKLASAFGSYGWSGEAVDNISCRLRQLKMNVIEGIKCRFKPSEKELEKTFEFGVEFANKITVGFKNNMTKY